MAALDATAERISQADAAIVSALHSLTRAICLLGFSEGQAAVQIAHITVKGALDAVRASNARRAA